MTKAAAASKLNTLTNNALCAIAIEAEQPLLWYPFIELLTAFTQRFFTKEKEHYTHFIENVSTDVPEIAIEALEKEIALLAINVPPPKVLEENSAVDKLLEKFDTNFDLSYDKFYKKIRLLEGEIYHYISELTIKNNYKTYNALLKVKTDEVPSMTYML